MIDLKKSFVIHPFILAGLPALCLYAYSAQEYPLSVLLWPLVVTLALTLLLVLSTWLICRSLNKAGVIISLFVALIFSTGYVFELKTLWGIIGSVISGVLLVLVWALLFPIVSYRVLKAQTDLRKATIILNVAAIGMLLMASFRIGVTEARRLSDDNNIMASEPAVHLNVSGQQALPDIYYIILDRYASAGMIAEIYDFDNSDFINYLTDQGFYVASESAANYVRTSQSLASSLNMEYIDYMDEDSKDLVPLNEKIRDNALQRSLKSAGYEFINVGSWWEPTRENRYADMNINYGASMSEFSKSLVGMTMPYSVLTNLDLVDDKYMEQWKRTLFEFASMADDIPTRDEPTFTFAHLLITHEPYVFDNDGSFLSHEEVSNRSGRDNYVNSVIATNNLVKELVNKLLSTSEVAPIIIIQADEGPYPERYSANYRGFNWEQATDIEIKQKMGILNAYYLPGVDRSVLYPSITPVNSFRLIFDFYFGTKLGLLPDVSYTYVDYGHPYRFLDVTDKVRFH